MVNDGIFQRSHRLHRWVPLVFAQKIFLSNETQCSKNKTTKRVAFSLCLLVVISVVYEVPTAILVWFFLFFILFLFVHHLCSEAKCNLMLIHVASCISKVRRWQHFVWKPYFRWYRCWMSKPTASTEISENPFCTICTYVGWLFEIVMLNRPISHKIRCYFSSFIYFAQQFALATNDQTNERKINGTEKKNWKITWHLINELV